VSLLAITAKVKLVATLPIATTLRNEAFRDRRRII
jgi:hypothetical protein